MEYAVSRAHEVKRLGYEQQIALKVAERNLGRGLMPWEIQNRFNLPPSKAAYLLPEIEAAQAAHTQRIKNEFYNQKIYPLFEYLSSLDIERVHAFDQVISDSTIDFSYQGATKKTRFRDQIGED